MSVIPKAAELVHCDPEYSVVMAALETYSDLLKELKGVVLKGEGHKEAIVNCVKAVLTNEVSDSNLLNFFYLVKQKRV